MSATTFIGDICIVHNPDLLGADAKREWFSPQWWNSCSAIVGAAQGRGSVHFVTSVAGTAVLRHYLRGGMMRFFSRDQFLWTGHERSRSVAEFHILQKAHQLGLPVPQPLAAGYRCNGVFYRADILIQAISHQNTLAQAISQANAEINWDSIGVQLGKIHAHGFCHADLNAHNILLQNGDCVGVVDFDRASQRGAGSWQQSNLNRLLRSLRKVSAGERQALLQSGWQQLLQAYRDHIFQLQKASQSK